MASNISYQTIGEFLSSPFGQHQDTSKFDKNYRDWVDRKKIYCENTCQVDDMYLIHVRIPSESQEGLEYDVVIQFFTNDKEIQKQNNLGLYYMQFYSNSPSFIYKYAALYGATGYLIESLYEKTDKNYISTMPEKANPELDLGADKSLYLACRFIYENKYSLLRKTGITMWRHVKFDKMLRSIKDFEDVKMDSDIRHMEDSIKKETEKDKLNAQKRRTEFLQKLNPFRKENRPVKKIRGKNNTVAPGGEHGVHVTKKKSSTHSTTTSQKRSITVMKKKRGGTSTTKK